MTYGGGNTNFRLQGARKKRYLFKKQNGVGRTTENLYRETFFRGRVEGRPVISEKTDRRGTETKSSITPDYYKFASPWLAWGGEQKGHIKEDQGASGGTYYV